MTRRSGRRPGNPDTREAILAAARRSFADNGFDGSTIRMIAADAGVDPALVHHYFGTKNDLFLAAVQVPVDPTPLIGELMGGDPHGIGERLVLTFLGVWDGPAGAAGIALLRSAIGSDRMAALFREFVLSQILRRVVGSLDVDPTQEPMRMALVATQIAGLGVVRYVLRLEPIAGADPELVATLVGPTVQRYLTAELPLDT